MCNIGSEITYAVKISSLEIHSGCVNLNTQSIFNFIIMNFSKTWQQISELKSIAPGIPKFFDRIVVFAILCYIKMIVHRSVV